MYLLGVEGEKNIYSMNELLMLFNSLLAEMCYYLCREVLLSVLEAPEDCIFFLLLLAFYSQFNTLVERK